MELILVVLLIPSVYFSARFFLISNNIKKAVKDFKYISENIDSNRKLKLSHPDKNFEKLLYEINKHLEYAQVNKLKYIKREEAIRREIENISHDLRTPLTSIRGYIKLINEENITIKEKKDYVYIVEKRAKVLQNLIEDFYDLSRLENNDYNLNMEVIDINKELREQILIFYNDFEKKNIEVDIKLEDQPVLAKLDRGVIKRVFINLIQNAIKYSKNSFSMSLNMKDRSRSNDSSGLGLTITKFLIDSMDGEINVEMDEDWIIFNIKFQEVLN